MKPPYWKSHISDRLLSDRSHTHTDEDVNVNEQKTGLKFSHLQLKYPSPKTVHGTHTPIHHVTTKLTQSAEQSTCNHMHR